MILPHSQQRPDPFSGLAAVHFIGSLLSTQQVYHLPDILFAEGNLRIIDDQAERIQKLRSELNAAKSPTTVQTDSDDDQDYSDHRSKTQKFRTPVLEAKTERKKGRRYESYRQRVPYT